MSVVNLILYISRYFKYFFKQSEVINYLRIIKIVACIYFDSELHSQS